MSDEIHGPGSAGIWTKSWIRRGVRVNKTRNRNHRHGAGKVHWLRYISKNDESNVNGIGYYVRLCNLSSRTEHVIGWSGLDVGNVPKDEPVTCRICLNLEDLL